MRGDGADPMELKDMAETEGWADCSQCTDHSVSRAFTSPALLTDGMANLRSECLAHVGYLFIWHMLDISPYGLHLVKTLNTLLRK